MKFIKIIMVIILLLGVVVFGTSFIANLFFQNKVKEEVTSLFSHLSGNEEVLQSDDLEGLPTPVIRWMNYSRVVEKEKIYAVRIKQKAEMKLNQDSKWLPVDAEQYFSVEEPGFIWKANIQMAPLITVVGRDMYFEGKGNMLIKPLALFSAVDSSGEEIDQGTLLRYLAETIWFPSAALSDLITWKEIDEHSAEAIMDYKGISASGIFTFNNKGEVTHFEAERYGDFNGEYSLETWAIPLSDYKEFDGIKIPTKGKVTWELDEGDFNWFNFEITEVEYNKPVPF